MVTLVMLQASTGFPLFGIPCSIILFTVFLYIYIFHSLLRSTLNNVAVGLNIALVDGENTPCSQCLFYFSLLYLLLL